MYIYLFQVEIKCLKDILSFLMTDSLLKVPFSVCQPASSFNFYGNFCSLLGLRNISVIIVESAGFFFFFNIGMAGEGPLFEKIIKHALQWTRAGEGAGLKAFLWTEHLRSNLQGNVGFPA